MVARLTGCLAGAVAAGMIGGAARAQPGPAGSPFCATAVAQQLAAWEVGAPARPQPAMHGGVIRHWPTSRLGEWVAEVRNADAVRVARVTPSGVTTVTWLAACAATSSEQPRPAAEAPRFTDAELEALVGTGRPGVVYVWSPHMPLSVDGYRNVAAAAAARGVAVHPVLEPGADRTFARTSLERGGLPPEALRVADSVELWFRDVHLHAPSILVFARGRIAGDAWPGYHSADEYGAFLDRVVAAQR